MRGPNWRTPTMGGDVWWNTLDSRNGFKLQQHKITNHCRVLDPADHRIDWGSEPTMRNTFYQVTAGKTS